MSHFLPTDADGFLVPSVVKGKGLDAGHPGHVLVDEKLKREEGLKIGDVLKDEISGEKLKVAGFTEGQTFSHTPVIYITNEKWEKIQQGFSKKGKAVVNAIAIQGGEDTVDKVESSLENVEVVSKEEALESIPSYQAEQTSLNMMIAFLFVIAAFVLAVFFYVITLQKTQQFGVLKALGAKTGYLAGNLIGQVILLSVISIGMGVGCTFGIQNLFPEGIPFTISNQMLVQYSLLLLAVAVLGSLLSLFRVVKVDAIEAIGRVE